tara:strand:+ start:550 stop:789 length:240 start_codon:yes stop_codon:yes gene_type:complete
MTTEPKSDTTFIESVARSNALGDALNGIENAISKLWEISPPHQRDEFMNGVEHGIVVVGASIIKMIEKETAKRTEANKI